MKYNPSLHKLSNGITVIFDPMDMETTSVKIRFNTGSRDEKPEQYGITHFCEHMFCCGTQRFPNRETIRRFLDQHGLNTNASTGNPFVQFYGDCLPEKLDILIDFLADRLQNSSFNPDSIEIERGAILDELNRNLDQDSIKYKDLMDRELFGNKNFVFCSKNLGSSKTIKSFSRNQLLMFIKSRLSSKNCTIIISGKIENQEQILQKLEQHFQFLKPFDVPENTDVAYTPKQAHLTQPGHNNTTISIFFKNIYPDGKEYKFQVFCVQRLRNFIRDKLQQCLRHNNGLVYSVSNTAYGNHKFSIGGIQTQTAPHNVKKCVALIAQTCADIYFNNTMTQEDLDLLNTRIKLNDAKFLDSRSDRESEILNHYHCNNELYDFESERKLKESITLQDIVKYTRGIFDEKNMSILTTGADHNCDLMQVWRDNFKPNISNILLKNMNDRDL